MGKIEIKKIPKELHPAGEQILKIMEDTKEPPKDYIWKKEGEYFVWNGKKWVPYEFEIITGNRCIQKNCGCVSKEEMAIRFDKFKKDVLAAVSRMTKSQETIDVADIRQQLAELKIIIHQLEEFENYYTKTEIDENYYTKSSIDEKTSELNNIMNVLNGSVSSLSRRVVGMESSVSDMLSTLNTMSSMDYSKFVIATDLSDGDDLDL